MSYLPKATSFEGFVKKEKRSWLNHECPVCHGYGGWNLTLNAYGEGKHFNAACSQCNGWGYVNEQDFNCIHDMQFVRNLGRCYNQYACSKCGKIENVDSSG